jgi:DNA-binding transcriptional LysR family regulator
LVSCPESNREIPAIPWREEKMMVAAAPSHPLAGRKTLGLADLAQQHFVAFDDELRVGREVKRYTAASTAAAALLVVGGEERMRSGVRVPGAGRPARLPCNGSVE